MTDPLRELTPVYERDHALQAKTELRVWKAP